MLQSTHVYVSSLFRKKLEPSDSQQFFLGGCIPDVRYFAGVPRDWTHFPREELTVKLPGADRSFLQGYDVHLALDDWTLESDIRTEMINAFPPVIRKLLSGSVIEVIIAMQCMRKMRDENDIALSCCYVDDLSRIGVEEKPMSEFVNAVQSMVDARNEGVFAEIMMSEPRFRENARLKKLHDVGMYIDNHRMVQRYLLATAKPHIDDFIGEFEAKYDPQF